MSDSPRPEDGSDQEKERSRDRDRDRERRSSRKDKEKSKDKSKRRSRSRSGEREKKQKKRSRSRSRDKERKSSRDRDKDRRSGDRDSGSRRSRDRDRRSTSRRSRSREKSPDPEAEEKKRQEEAAKADREANTDKYTVFVSQIHPKVDERDLFEFFSHVGRVEDIRLIRDQRTQKSKGLCYVEFHEKESVHKAVTLTGQLIGGYPISIVVCEDKSRPVQPLVTPLRLYVGQLHLNVSDGDLKPVFEAFGPLDFIDLHKDPVTGTSKGFGFVQFKNEADGKSALESLNGLEIAGQAIKVGIVDQNNDTTNTGDAWEADENVMLTAQSRAALMQKLGRGAAPPAAPAQAQQPAAAAMNIPMVQPTTCIVIKNMFDPKTETDADFDLDIKEDVEEEANKFGPIKHIFVDKNSQGYVYLRFDAVDAAEKLRSTFHGRWFASRQISAEFVIEQTYILKFPEAR